ncbi:unnamed protein product [Bursaphelenchus okinawaensis]|uniref:Uncharacterized protein n=1 Tax=Bursaphelenchus okinawaensis TaxID=465554 RepID=A0A811LS12_9BILA|nr:unnamed protein product [Bursaphelenchus okinawaensis]CAG9128567.1 unnamed protein product [Bursaphelenchus okinawaensis]
MTNTRRSSLNTVRGDVASLQSRQSALEINMIKMADAVADLAREQKRTNDEIKLMRMEIRSMRMEIRSMRMELRKMNNNKWKEVLVQVFAIMVSAVVSFLVGKGLEEPFKGLATPKFNGTSFDENTNAALAFCGFFILLGLVVALLFFLKERIHQTVTASSAPDPPSN